MARPFNNPFPLPLRLFSLATAAALVFCLFVLGSDPEAVKHFPIQPPWDKVVHFGVYGILASLIRVGTVRATYLTIVAIVTLTGAMDELHQLSLPFRTASYLDLAADFLGSVASMGWFWLTSRGLKAPD